MKRSGRRSHRDQLAAVKTALDGMATLAGKPKLNFLTLPPEPKKRAAAGSDGRPLEKDIQADILSYLHQRRDVVFVGRFNSGTSVEHNGNQTRYTRFHTVPGFPDIHGMLVGGRAFWIEVKRPGSKTTPQQEAFIGDVSGSGGLAFVARSVQEVIERLP